MPHPVARGSPRPGRSHAIASSFPSPLISFFSAARIDSPGTKRCCPSLPALPAPPQGDKPGALCQAGNGPISIIPESASTPRAPQAGGDPAGTGVPSATRGRGGGHAPGFGNDPSSTSSSLVAAATPGPGTEQCHSARQDVTLAAESQGCKARLLRQESGAKPLPHPSRALGRRQPHIFQPGAPGINGRRWGRPRSPSRRRGTGGSQGTRQPETPGRRRETRQGSESIKETFRAPHTGPARIIYCRFRCYVLNLITEKL